jgi:uncharacterized membrane protein YbhN (UPF0104 family)
MRLRTLVTSHRVAALVGVGVLGVLFWRAGPAHVWAALARLSIPALLVTLGLNVPITLLRALRTRLVLARLHQRVGWWSLVKAQLAGQTLSGLTPAASGDLVRAWIWRRDNDVPATSGVATVVYERILSFALLLAAGAAFFGPTIGGPGVVVGLCVGAALAIAVPWTLAHVPQARAASTAVLNVAARLPLLRTRTRAIGRMGSEVAVLAGDTPLLLTFTLTTLVVFVLSGLQIILLVAGLGGGDLDGLAAAIGVYALSQAGGSLSALPFGIGPADAIVVGLLLRTGTPFGIATTVALLLRGTITLPIGLAAAAAMAGDKPERMDDPADTAAAAAAAAAAATAAAPKPTHAGAAAWR